jgi:tRNA pseudouridine synthase 10
MKILPLRPVAEISTLAVKFEYAYVFVAGRYNKYSRTLSQTPWVIDGKRKSESSVEELIAEHVVRLFEADGFSFSSAGREDIDVRMLGNGRPFLLEIHNPRNPFVTNEQLAEAERLTNNGSNLIFVRDLQNIPKEDCQQLKEGEEHKKKTYRCVVCLSEPLTPQRIAILDSLKEKGELQVQQDTPIRVLHRRTLSTRPKMIYGISYELIHSHALLLDLETQAGTYIKEFVHGDFGRTRPNLGSLLDCEADILQLDVLSIVFDWPPPMPRV